MFVSKSGHVSSFLFKRYWLKTCIKYNFLNRNIENRDSLHWRSARRKTNSISDGAIQKFLITRSISLKKNSASGKKKNHKKSLHGKWHCHVDKFGSNDDLDTFRCEDINGTFTACGGDVTFWKVKKFWYFTDNHITVILIIYRKCYNIKRNVPIVYIFFQPRALFQTSFVSERYLLVLILTRAIIIYSTLSSFVTCSSRASAA